MAIPVSSLFWFYSAQKCVLQYVSTCWRLFSNPRVGYPSGVYHLPTSGWYTNFLQIDAWVLLDLKWINSVQICSLHTFYSSIIFLLFFLIWKKRRALNFWKYDLKTCSIDLKLSWLNSIDNCPNYDITVGVGKNVDPPLTSKLKPTTSQKGLSNIFHLFNYTSSPNSIFLLSEQASDQSSKQAKKVKVKKMVRTVFIVIDVL